MTVSITGDLVLHVDGAEVALSPRAGLRLAEDLARKSFRRVLDDEAQKAADRARARAQRGAPQ